MKLILAVLLLFVACSETVTDEPIMRARKDTTDNLSVSVDTTIKEFVINIDVNKYGSNKQDNRGN